MSEPVIYPAVVNAPTVLNTLDEVQFTVSIVPHTRDIAAHARPALRPPPSNVPMGRYRFGGVATERQPCSGAGVIKVFRRTVEG